MSAITTQDPVAFYPGSMTIPAVAAPRVDRLQGLRGVAAISVVIFHAIANYAPAGSLLTTHGLYNLLACGVDGFIIRYTTWNSFGPSHVSSYLRKRIARVVPLYWVLTAIVVGLAAVAPHLFRTYVFAPAHAAASFLFLPWPNQDGAIFPPLVPGWSLTYEMLFYGVFAVLMLLVRRERAVFWLAVVFGASILIVRGFGLRPEIFVMGNDYVLEFVMGAFFADIWRRRSGAIPRLWGVIGLLIGLASLSAMMGATLNDATSLIVRLAAGSGLVVAWMSLPGLSLAPWSLRLVETLGDASYSIYLAHPLVLGPAAKVFASLGLFGGAGLPGVSAIAVCGVVAGLVCYRLLEQPLLGQSRRLLRVG